MYGAALAAVPSYRPDLGEAWDVAKIYWTAMSLSKVREGRKLMADAGIEDPFEEMDLDNPPRFMVEDDAIACEVDGGGFAQAKMDAMRAHATQIEVDGPFFALSNHVGNQVLGVEAYRIAKGQRGDLGPDGLETDLFAGL
jgi:N-acetyl-1-D-myo-inositol-2-amino-2-deoxy-alpha-D-glucopyranoside deacetylase